MHLEKGAIDVAEKTILQDNANERNSKPCRVRQVDEKSLFESSEDEAFTISSVSTDKVGAMQDKRTDTKIFATMQVGKQLVRFQVDTGSTCNIIQEQDLPANTTISDDGHVLTMYNETQLQSFGKCNLRFFNVKNGKKYRTEFVVVTNGTPLLGAKAAQVMKRLEVQHQNIALIEDDAKTTEEIKQPNIADQSLPTKKK